jgi:hypothetical protein
LADKAECSGSIQVRWVIQPDLVVTLASDAHVRVQQEKVITVQLVGSGSKYLSSIRRPDIESR